MYYKSISIRSSIISRYRMLCSINVNSDVKIRANILAARSSFPEINLSVSELK